MNIEWSKRNRTMHTLESNMTYWQHTHSCAWSSHLTSKTTTETRFSHRFSWTSSRITWNWNTDLCLRSSTSARISSKDKKNVKWFTLSQIDFLKASQRHSSNASWTDNRRSSRKRWFVFLRLQWRSKMSSRSTTAHSCLACNNWLQRCHRRHNNRSASVSTRLNRLDTCLLPWRTMRRSSTRTAK